MTDPERIYKYKILGFKIKYLLALFRIKENSLEDAEFSWSVIHRKEMMEAMAFRQHLQHVQMSGAQKMHYICHSILLKD